jgi:hypothetical protein
MNKIMAPERSQNGSDVLKTDNLLPLSEFILFVLRGGRTMNRGCKDFGF